MQTRATGHTTGTGYGTGHIGTAGYGTGTTGTTGYGTTAAAATGGYSSQEAATERAAAEEAAATGRPAVAQTVTTAAAAPAAATTGQPAVCAQEYFTKVRRQGFFATQRFDELYIGGVRLEARNLLEFGFLALCTGGPWAWGRLRVEWPYRYGDSRAQEKGFW